VVFDQYIQFEPQAAIPGKSVQTGVLKVPDFIATPAGAPPFQLGAQLAVFPDAKTLAPTVNANGSIDPTSVNYGPGGQEARFPVVQIQLYVGDLGLNSGTPQPVDALDTSKMTPYFPDAHPVPIVMGSNYQFGLVQPDGSLKNFTVSFPDLRQYAHFLIKKDDGVGLIYLSFGLVMLGLITKLYVKPFVERRAKGKQPIELSGVVLEGLPVDHEKATDRQETLRV
jgi:cytochrome c biogenesis protein ResB